MGLTKDVCNSGLWIKQRTLPHLSWLPDLYHSRTLGISTKTKQQQQQKPHRKPNLALLLLCESSKSTLCNAVATSHRWPLTPSQLKGTRSVRYLRQLYCEGSTGTVKSAFSSSRKVPLDSAVLENRFWGTGPIELSPNVF